MAGNMNKLERYSHTVTLGDGTELVPIKTQGSIGLRDEAIKRIGESRFYGALSYAEITSGCAGSTPRMKYYLPLVDFDRYNDWEQLSKYEAMATNMNLIQLYWVWMRDNSWQRMTANELAVAGNLLAVSHNPTTRFCHSEMQRQQLRGYFMTDHDWRVTWET